MSLMYTIEKMLYIRNRSVPVFREYDERRGFKTWSDECRSSTGRHKPDPERDILGTQGFTHLRVLPVQTACDIRRQFDLQDASLVERKTSAISQTIAIDDINTLKSVVAGAITSEVDQILFDYFKSEYCAYWYSMQRALPNKKPKRAFLWHCDKGPTMHAKMLLYFTAVADTGGNTYLLDRKSTVAFDKAGYLFGSQKNRLDDLAGLAASNGIPYSPFSFDLTPGEAILFLPHKVLHRGVLPTKAPRFIMQITFLPSKMHWREALFRDNSMSLEELAKDYAWPRNAGDLRLALGG